MSEPGTSRPRPKPRPRPQLPKQPSGPSGSVPIDSDDLFVVNRGRTRETWQKLEALNKDISRPSSDAESCNGDEPTTPRKRQKTDGTPRWKRDQQALRMLSVELSDNDGSDFGSDIEVIDKPVLNKGKAVSLPRRPSRSRSITPPPEVPAAVLENARNLIRRAMQSKRASSPTYEDDFDISTDTIVLDPELERIAKAVKSQSLRNHKVGEGEKLSVQVKWRRHPLRTMEAEPVFSYKILMDESFRELFDFVARDIRIPVTWLVLTHKNKRLFASAKPDALGLWGEVEFVGCESKTYEYLQQEAREKRQTPSPVKGKPPSDRIPHNAKVIDIPSDGEESDNDTPDTQPSPRENFSPPQTQITQESDAESDAGGKFKLVLRSDKSAKDITLIVRSTTKCGSIVKAYIKKIGLADQYPHIFEEVGSASASPAPPTTTRGRGGRGRGRGRGRGKAKVQAEKPNVPLADPRISVDGDRMESNTEIGNADLEDGDMVEVVGL